MANCGAEYERTEAKFLMPHTGHVSCEVCILGWKAPTLPHSIWSNVQTESLPLPPPKDNRRLWLHHLNVWPSLFSSGGGLSLTLAERCTAAVAVSSIRPGRASELASLRGHARGILRGDPPSGRDGAGRGLAGDDGATAIALDDGDGDRAGCRETRSWIARSRSLIMPSQVCAEATAANNPSSSDSN